MYRKFSRSNQLFVSALFLALVGSAVAFTRHNTTFAKVFASGPASVLPKEQTQDVASNRPLVKLFLSGVIERDSENIPVEKAGSVRPGEVVSFTMNSVNEGSAPARDYRAIGQIPRGATFVAGSALGDRHTQVSYSIDDGQQFSSNPMIDEKQADGTIKKIAAPVSMYTQVRFEWVDPLAAGGKLVASYQVRVK